MRQLTMSDILKLNKKFLEFGYTQKEIDDFVIFLSNKDELNAAHNVWFCQLPNIEKEDYKNENSRFSESKFKNKCILIS